MKYDKILKELGFSTNEINVYVSLLELDSSGVTDISKKSSINRTSCYDILESLVKKGLVSKFKKEKKIYFTASDPKRLLSYLDREKEENNKKIDQQKNQIEEILPELSSLINPRSTRPKVSFYEGVKGMREAYEDTLTAKGGILAYANVETMHEGLPNFFPEYYSRRTKARANIKAIMPNNPASIDRAKKDKEEIRESIILKDKSKTFSPEVNIYNNKILITSWKEKMAVIIESKELADLQRLTYNMLWDYLKKDEEKESNT
jgi:sugar-specific transcriptional regulator TrmB